MNKICFDDYSNTPSIIYEEHGTFYILVSRPLQSDPQLGHVELSIVSNASAINYTNCIHNLTDPVDLKYAWPEPMPWQQIIKRPLELIMEALL